jgi:hypothetical protein
MMESELSAYIQGCNVTAMAHGRHGKLQGKMNRGRKSKERHP